MVLIWTSNCHGYIGIDIVVLSSICVVRASIFVDRPNFERLACLPHEQYLLRKERGMKCYSVVLERIQVQVLMVKPE